MKKNLFWFFAILLVFSITITAPTAAFAYGSGDVPFEIGTENVVVEREDVSLIEALSDPSFSPFSSNNNDERANTANHWEVSGYTEHSGGYSQCRAVGHSAEYDEENELLDTYHYTRTFFGSTNNKVGDSGRVWGNGLVYAFGTWVATMNVNNLIQRVYYGTVS